MCFSFKITLNREKTHLNVSSTEISKCLTFSDWIFKWFSDWEPSSVTQIINSRTNHSALNVFILTQKSCSKVKWIWFKLSSSCRIITDEQTDQFRSSRRPGVKLAVKTLKQHQSTVILEDDEEKELNTDIFTADHSSDVMRCSSRCSSRCSDASMRNKRKKLWWNWRTNVIGCESDVFVWK